VLWNGGALCVIVKYVLKSVLLLLIALVHFTDLYINVLLTIVVLV